VTAKHQPPNERSDCLDLGGCVAALILRPEIVISLHDGLGGGGVGLLLRDFGPVDDPQPRAVGLAAQDLHPDAGVVGRAGGGQG
jgi:hypothetical protein